MKGMLERLLGEDIEFETKLDPTGTVEADPTQLHQVLMNLAVNARDAMPQGGRLLIETQDVELDEAFAQKHVGGRSGSYVMLAVSDSGMGMDEETLRHAFDPFYTTKSGGTGLGLSTVYGIVKQSGGNVWAYSELEKGTSIRVFLPRVDLTPPPVVVESETHRVDRGWQGQDSGGRGRAGSARTRAAARSNRADIRCSRPPTGQRPAVSCSTRGRASTSS